MDPACEVNERGTREPHGNEVVDDCDLPVDLELTERVEVNDETLPSHMPKKTGTAQSKLKLIKECSLVIPSPWKHVRAREEETRRNTTHMVRILL